MNAFRLVAAIGILLVTPGLAQEALKIRPAVELEFPTVAQALQQVEASSDLITWRVHTAAALGDGQPRRLLASAGGGTEFYRVSTVAVRDLNALLEPIRAANRVPALACAVILSNQVVGLGAVGQRRFGTTNAPVTLADRWHHGSLTKSMTATLAAVLVREGRIQWTTTLADVFPERAASMNPAWRTVTLDWLCSNRSGAPENLTANGLWQELWDFKGLPRDGRRLLMQRVTARAPNATPGTRYEYSNAGFSMAGHMLETVMNRPWEDLLTEKVFVPLGMSSAGFGVPASPRYIDQPWGHQWLNGAASPVEPGLNADNPPAIGPAGTVHCSILDLGRYAAFHVAVHNADTELLPMAAGKRLHTAVPDNASYAYGWNEVDRPWAAPGKAYTHSGSNLMWFSVIWFAPARGFAVVALCNVASSTATNPGAAATDQVAGRMIQEFLK
ncbi:MAG: beta-lactamase family protein [Verrucomicrobiales bacterium]|nr:beta-lactamase family protein [Verrucomicrobiales bacterium]